MKKNKQIYIISNSSSLIINHKLIDKSEYSFNTIMVKDDKSCSIALFTSSKKADLIIIMNNHFTSINETTKIIKNIDFELQKGPTFGLQLLVKAH